jgi:hypothetical protein
MSSYLPNIPQPNDNLDFSQGQLLGNFQALDAIFGIDHYKYSDTTGNLGFHNTITMPRFTTSPPTPNPTPPATTTNPILYTFQDSTNIGPLQYSRGLPAGANPVPASPITFRNNQIGGDVFNNGGTLPILDFTGLSKVLAYLTYYAKGGSPFFNGPLLIIFDSGTFIAGTTGATQVQIMAAGNVLQFKNNGPASFTNLYWTLQFIRIE